MFLLDLNFVYQQVAAKRKQYQLKNLILLSISFTIKLLDVDIKAGSFKS